MKTLEQYFDECAQRQVIDHAVRVQRQADGSLTFYIHPAGVSGDTLDFVVKGDRLIPAGWAHGFMPENVVKLDDYLKELEREAKAEQVAAIAKLADHLDTKPPSE